MLQFEIDGVWAVVERIDATRRRLYDFIPVEAAQELTEWQIEDMNRRYPNMETQGVVTLTRIWPRSRLSDERRAVRRERPRRTGRPLPVLRAPPIGERPILRPELVQSFCERMTALFPEKIHW